jgi:hypothetical protein
MKKTTTTTTTMLDLVDVSKKETGPAQQTAAAIALLKIEQIEVVGKTIEMTSFYFCGHCRVVEQDQ